MKASTIAAGGGAKTAAGGKARRRRSTRSRRPRQALSHKLLNRFGGEVSRSSRRRSPRQPGACARRLCSSSTKACPPHGWKRHDHQASCSDDAVRGGAVPPPRNNDIDMFAEALKDAQRHGKPRSNGSKLPACSAGATSASAAPTLLLPISGVGMACATILSRVLSRGQLLIEVLAHLVPIMRFRHVMGPDGEHHPIHHNLSCFGSVGMRQMGCYRCDVAILHADPNLSCHEPFRSWNSPPHRSNNLPQG